ncbi:2Fe-2S iron-sulfur cluster-binding protein [Pseudonocardia kunmingensis]|uniref:2Fe-2S ferredoxin n=1 Tax=Pseudonocardia kunmingensis TaxID=630975 RepID=A0A543CWZ2_9PSEU|nr:2Fe-2S iron-sulfur cluster-binding protein [Pseudonocardia kunmingensis]TQM01633.1 2Fe-2S ferredoxin [Pseudonocardia kunmingensis]
MARITYVEHDGTEHVVDADPGTTVMEAAIDNGVPGIDADCGGVCSCATCHVYVVSDPQPDLPARSGAELEMLEFAVGRQDNSRLSCRLVVSHDSDELVVTIPESQI